MVTAKIRRVGDAESHLLALHVAARLRRADLLVCPDAGQDGITGLLRWDNHPHRDQPDDGRGGPKHPALPGIAHHLAEHVEQPRPD